jgi:ParB/RepB/Spo0J family partition protein
MMKLKYIPCDQIRAGRNVRLDVDEDLGSLMRSISQFDLLQPILVTSNGPDRYDLIFGHRRLAAMRSRGEREIPCIIRDDLSETDIQSIKLQENIHRKQLSAREFVAAIDAMKMKEPYLTDAQIAQRIGRTPAWISFKRRAWRAYQALAESGMNLAALDEIGDTDLFRMARGIPGALNENRSKAAKATIATRAARTPNGHNFIMAVNILRISSYGKRSIFIFHESPERRQELLDYLKKYKPKESSRRKVIRK